MNTSTLSALHRVMAELALRRRAATAGLAQTARDHLEALGIDVADGMARLDDGIELLSPAAIRAALGAHAASWLRELDVRASIDSTNAALLQRAADGSIAGCALAAEVQLAGRGRRGRAWLSPFGRNIALSLGLASSRPAAEIGALSLVAGLAVRAALADCGVEGVELKWPNDVLLDGRKLAGILIELVRATPPVEVVVGIGVNVGGGAVVAPRVEQSIADVAERLDAPSRNALLAAIVNRVVAAWQRFEDAGLAPFRAPWEAAHRFQGKVVEVALPAGGGTACGTVLGISDDGALRLATDAGEREFNSGEVSVRERAPRRASAGSGAP